MPNREFFDVLPLRCLRTNNSPTSRPSGKPRCVDRVDADGGGRRDETLVSGDEAYAYGGAGGVHWGVNDGSTGFNTHRGKVPYGTRA